MLAGLEYDSCCWSLRVVARRYLNDIEGDQLNGVFVQVLLKGLGSIGRKSDGLLNERIPNFVGWD